jgi:SAM-dependent methyltransferase
VSDRTETPGGLETIYRNRFAGRGEYRTQVWRVLVADFFSRWIPPEAAVLDLGCGYCEFINQVTAGRKYAMDLNPHAGRQAAADVTVFEQDCTAPWPVPEGTLDVVFTSNFFEHLPAKHLLEETLRQAWRALRRGGVLIAMGPNIKHLPGAYWDFYDHYLPLTELSLAEVLRKCGFTVEQTIPRFLPYTMSDRRYPLWMLRAYLALPAAWRFFGKQFLMVARKA